MKRLGLLAGVIVLAAGCGSVGSNINGTGNWNGNGNQSNFNWNNNQTWPDAAIQDFVTLEEIQSAFDVMKEGASLRSIVIP